MLVSGNHKGVVGMSKTIRVFLVEDSPTLRMCLRQFLEQASDIVVVGEAENMDEGLTQIGILLPDVALLDCKLLGIAGTEILKAMRQKELSTQVLAYGNCETELDILRILQTGVVGYVAENETPERIVEAVRAAAQGKRWFSSAAAVKIAEWLTREHTEVPKLTRRESKVLQLLARGMSNGEIAKELNITERTVRFHLQNIYEKIQVRSRTEAVIWAMQHGLTSKG
jgi:DNA-binding NarL/FixJ family response regulator